MHAISGGLRLCQQADVGGLRIFSLRSASDRHGGLSLMVRAAVCGTAYSGSTPGVHPWVPRPLGFGLVRIRHVMPP